MDSVVSTCDYRDYWCYRDYWGYMVLFGSFPICNVMDKWCIRKVVTCLEITTSCHFQWRLGSWIARRPIVGSSWTARSSWRRLVALNLDLIGGGSYLILDGRRPLVLRVDNRNLDLIGSGRSPVPSRNFVLGGGSRYLDFSRSDVHINLGGNLDLDLGRSSSKLSRYRYLVLSRSVDLKR